MWFTAPSSNFPKVDRNKIIWRKFKQWNNSFVELLNLQLSQSCSDWKFLFGWIQLSGQAWIDQLNQERGNLFLPLLLNLFSGFRDHNPNWKKNFSDNTCVSCSGVRITRCLVLSVLNIRGTFSSPGLHPWKSFTPLIVWPKSWTNQTFSFWCNWASSYVFVHWLIANICRIFR